MTKQEKASVGIKAIQYAFLAILVAIPWLLSSDYSIAYNIASLAVFIPLFKLTSSPKPMKIVTENYQTETVFVDIIKNPFNPGPKRKIVFYRWYLIWIPIFKRNYTFADGEGFLNVIRECYNDYRINRNGRDRNLEKRVKNFKKEGTGRIHM